MLLLKNFSSLYSNNRRNYRCIEIIEKIQEVFNRELDLENSRDLVFYHYDYRNYVPNIGTVNKALHILLIKLNISPMISTKGVRNTYGSYLWHNSGIWRASLMRS